MTKKTIAFVVYPGISLLELVGNRTVLGIILAQEGSVLSILKNKRLYFRT